MTDWRAKNFQVGKAVRKLPSPIVRYEQQNLNGIINLPIERKQETTKLDRCIEFVTASQASEGTAIPQTHLNVAM